MALDISTLLEDFSNLLDVVESAPRHPETVAPFTALMTMLVTRMHEMEGADHAFDVLQFGEKVLREKTDGTGKIVH